MGQTVPARNNAKFGTVRYSTVTDRVGPTHLMGYGWAAASHPAAQLSPSP